jgi:predicted dinucleotide-binding enzyme
MKIGIVGSGFVGQILGGKLVSLGHDVVMGTRTPGDLDSEKGRAGSLAEWLRSSGKGARVGTLAEAASHGELVINATPGEASVDALNLAGAGNLSGKVIVDVSNELDYSGGMPPRSLATDSEDGSVGMRIQQAFPDSMVVKTLNTVNALVMVDPGQLAGGDHSIFVCGDDAGAKAKATRLLQSFGWRDVVDLGGIEAARGPEMYMALWLRFLLMTGFAPGRPPKPFNIKLVR